MVEYSERLQWAMNRRGVKIPELAEAVDISYQAIKKLLDGKSKSMNAANNEAAARFLDVNSYWLATGKGPRIPTNGSVDSPASASEDLRNNIYPATGDNFRRLDDRRPVPLISWIRAGMWADIVDNFHPGEADEWFTPVHSKPKEKSFALTVEGESMTSPYPGSLSFPAGTIIIVDPDQAYTPGCFVVAKDVVTQQATFKQLTTDGGRWFLKPLNPTFPTIEIDDPAVRVIGRVCEFHPPGGKL